MTLPKFSRKTPIVLGLLTILVVLLVFCSTSATAEGVESTAAAGESKRTAAAASAGRSAPAVKADKPAAAAAGDAAQQHPSEGNVEILAVDPTKPAEDAVDVKVGSDAAEAVEHAKPQTQAEPVKQAPPQQQPKKPQEPVKPKAEEHVKQAASQPKPQEPATKQAAPQAPKKPQAPPQQQPKKPQEPAKPQAPPQQQPKKPQEPAKPQAPPQQQPKKLQEPAKPQAPPQQQPKKPQETAKPQAPPQAKPTSSNPVKSAEPIADLTAIRSRATAQKDGCATTTFRYLTRIHEERRAVAAAFSKARAEVNEARVHKPQTVAKAQQAFEVAKAALAAYDAQTYEQFGGSLPKTCIGEVQAYLDKQPEPTSANNYVQSFTRFYNLLNGHARTIYLTAEGVVRHTMHTYTPMVASFKQMTENFYKKANDLQREVNAPEGFIDKLTGRKKEMSKKDVVLKSLQGTMYGIAPIAIMVVGAILALVFSPILIAALLLPDLLLQVWFRIFILYFNYGLTFPAGLMQSLHSFKTALFARKWDVVQTRITDAFFQLAIDADQFYYNGILVIFLLSIIVVVTLLIVRTWAGCFIFSRKSKKSNKQKQSPASAAKKKN